jgi:hypothetical protein
MFARVPAFLHMEALDAERRALAREYHPPTMTWCEWRSQGIGLPIATSTGTYRGTSYPDATRGISEPRTGLVDVETHPLGRPPPGVFRATQSPDFFMKIAHLSRFLSTFHSPLPLSYPTQPTGYRVSLIPPSQHSNHRHGRHRQERGLHLSREGPFQ